MQTSIRKDLYPALNRVEKRKLSVLQKTLNEAGKLSKTEEKAYNKLIEKQTEYDKKHFNKDRQENTKKGYAVNAFARTPTTVTKPYSIRFLDSEKTQIANLVNKLKSESPDLIANKLGSLNEVNASKIIRASLYLLQDRTNEEILDAIHQARTVLYSQCD